MNTRKSLRILLLPATVAWLLVSACAPVVVCRDSSKPLAGFPVPTYEELISIYSAPDTGPEIGKVRIPSSRLHCAIQRGTAKTSDSTDLVQRIKGTGLEEMQNGITFQGAGPVVEGVPNNCLTLTDGKIQPGYYRPMGKKICPVLLSSSVVPREISDSASGHPGKDIHSEINIYRESRSPDYAELTKLVEILANKLRTEQGPPAQRIVNFGSRGNPDSGGSGSSSNELTVKFEPVKLTSEPLKMELNPIQVVPGVQPAPPNPRGISFAHVEVELGSKDGTVCAKKLQIHFDGSSGIESVLICPKEPLSSPVAFLSVKTVPPQLSCQLDLLTPEISSSSSKVLTVIPNKKEVEVMIPGKWSVSIQLAAICGDL